MRLLLLMLLSSRAAALLSSSYRIDSPCPPSVAAMLCPDAAISTANSDSADWYVHPEIIICPSALLQYFCVLARRVAVMPVPRSPLYLDDSVALRPPTPTVLAMPSTLVGAPAAIGRLCLSNGKGRIDQLRTEVPKEDPESAMLLGLVLDSLLLRWMEQCAGEGSAFESLSASASPHAASVLTARGFLEIEKPDFTALGRGEPIETHRVRLPACILAYESLWTQAGSDDVLDLALAASVLSSLRQQPTPKMEESGPDEQESATSSTKGDDDPFASIKRLAGL